MLTFFQSSIGRKVLMALTGLGLSLFLLAHVAGNLIILVDHQKFNLYAHQLISMGPILWAAEIGLAAVFALHVVMALKLTLKNRSARPQNYALRASTGRSRRTWGSSSMAISGLIVLVFVVLHIKHFKFGPSEFVMVGDVEVRDLASLVVAEFSQWGTVLFYVLALILIGVHLKHGFRSLFDTLGLDNRRFECLLHKVSVAFVFLVIGGFLLIPIWIYFSKGSL